MHSKVPTNDQQIDTGCRERANSYRIGFGSLRVGALAYGGSPLVTLAALEKRGSAK